MNKLRLIQTLLIVGAIAAVGLPRIQDKVGMHPGRLYVNYLTLYDDYSVEARAVRTDGSVDRIADEAHRFFSPDIEELSFGFNRRSFIDNNLDFPSDNEILWDGEQLVPNGASELVVELSEREGRAALPDLASVRVNGLQAEPKNLDGVRRSFNIPREPTVLERIELSLSTDVESPTDLIERLYVVETEPQSVFISEVHLVREIDALGLFVPVVKWDAEALAEFFEASDGVTFDTSTDGFLELKPNTESFSMELSSDIQEALHGPIDEIHRNVVLMFSTLFIVSLLLLAYSLYRYLPLLTPSLFSRIIANIKRRVNNTGVVLDSLDGLGSEVFGKRRIAAFNANRLSPLSVQRLRNCLYGAFRRFTAAVARREPLNSLQIRGINLAMTGVLLGLFLIYSSPEGGTGFWLGLIVSLSGGIFLTHRSGTRSREDVNAFLLNAEARSPHRKIARHFVCHGEVYGWIGFAVIATLVVVSQLHRLGDQYMRLDETYSFFPAQVILETGEPVYPRTGFSYYRAETYHRIVAWFMEQFGVSRFAARLPNAIFNVGTLGVIYLFGKRISIPAGLAAAGYWATLPHVLDMSHQVRMYPMFWFLFALSAYLLYWAAISNRYSLPKLHIGKWDLSFNALLLALFLPVYALAIETQNLSGILLFGVLAFFILQLFTSRNKRRSLLAIIAIVVMLFVAADQRAGTYSWYEAFIEDAAPGWTLDSAPEFSNVSDSLQTQALLWFIFPVAIAGAFHERNRLIRFVIAVAAAGVIFIGIHYAQTVRYWSVILPFFSVAAMYSIRVLWLNRASLALRLIAVLFVGLVALGHVPAFGEKFSEAHKASLYSESDPSYQKWFDYIALFNNHDTTLMAGRHLSYTTVSENIEPDFSVEGHPRYGFDSLEYAELQRFALPNAIFGFVSDAEEILPFVEGDDRTNRFWRHPQFDSPQVFITSEP